MTNPNQNPLPSRVYGAPGFSVKDHSGQLYELLVDEIVGDTPAVLGVPLYELFKGSFLMFLGEYCEVHRRDVPVTLQTDSRDIVVFYQFYDLVNKKTCWLGEGALTRMRLIPCDS